ncbi:beta strand repeat-containing protein [Myroides odoratus]|uniref:beta strand repeat-containing protein n=1 Tax=Myroides odoratus TaxID=256 RepID=UPI0039AF8FBB
MIENITEILNDTTVQNDIYTTVAAQGKATTAADGSIQIDNGGQSVLSEMQISVANQGITPAKIQPGTNKQLLLTDANGAVIWADASDTIIKEIVAQNEVVTLLVDGGDGTFTYYNEKGIDADGNLISGQGVKFDANTLRIEKNAANSYEFYDKTSTTTPIAVIDVAGSVIENITEILNDTTVQNTIYTTVAAQGKATTAADGSIQIDNGDQSVLSEMQISVANQGITTTKIKPGANKQLLVTDANGQVAWVDASDTIIKEIIEGNDVVTLLVDGGDGTFTYYNENGIDADGNLIAGQGIKFDANTLRIEKNAANKYEFYDKTSDTTPIAVIDVAGSVIENITEILNTEEVKNEIFTTVAANGKKMASNDGSIAITGGDKAVLNGVIVNIQQAGVKTDHIKDGAVTTQKITSAGSVKGAILTADGLGNTGFSAPSETVKPAMQGDLEGEAGVINIVGGGENVLFGDANKKVSIEINQGGITGTHIGFETIENNNIAKQTIGVTKLDATGETAGNVATVKADGTVSYQPLTSAIITDKGDITTDGIVSVDNGTGKVLGNVTLGINNQSVTASKLDATGAVTGAVATANADGTVTYKPLEAESLAAKGTLATDGIVTVDNGTDKVLADVTLGIKDKGITATQIADNTITNEQIALNTITVDRLSAGNEPPKRVMVIDENGIVKWGELDDLVTDAAGNLTTDSIIEITTGDGVNSLFNDVGLGIKDASITNQKIADKTVEIGKLSNAGSQPGMVMVTNTTGGFTYVDRETIVQAGEDLTLGNELEFLAGNGVSTLLAEAKIGIKEGGISTDKIGNQAVTPAKISSVGADENTVLTADGAGNVTYKKINEAAFEGTEADLKSDGSLLVPLANKAVLKETVIGIANSGVQTAHISNKAVTAAKIDAQTAVNGAVLTADGSGNAVFQSLDQVAQAQGKVLSSTDSSLAITANNKAVLQDVTIDVASSGIKSTHIAAMAVTEDKIGTNKGAGLVLTSNGAGGAEFKTLGQVIGTNGKAIEGSAAIAVEGGEHAALADVTIDVVDAGITAAKLAANSVTTAKIEDQAVTVNKITGDGGTLQLLGTNRGGEVKWLNADSDILKVIINSHETSTVLHDNGDGTFTYYNESQIDSEGNVIPGATGVKFNANTLKITQNPTGVFTFLDKSGTTPLAKIDTRAKSITFEDHSSIEYNNVEEAIFALNQKIEHLEELDIQKETLSGNGILVNGNANATEAVFKAIELSIADEAVTPTKIKGGIAKQILVTNALGKAQWVDATDDIIEEIVNTQERLTILQDNQDGTLTYFNEEDVDKNGTIIGSGVSFNANTLRIDSTEPAKYVFYDKLTNNPLATIDVQADVIEKITEILSDTTVQEHIYTTIVAQGKAVATDNSIAVSGGEKAVLQEMTISLRDGGVTAAKLFAGANKENFVPVAQADGTVEYQSMATVLQGHELAVDNSLEITGTGDASKALLQAVGLQVKEEGIANSHIQNLAVTAAKIGSELAEKGEVLTADGSGNAVFITSDEVIAPTMQGDLVGTEGIIVQGGENVLFGDEETSVVVKINDGGVKGKHIAASTITNTNIADHTIQAPKLTAGQGLENRVGVANAAGEITYQMLTSDIIIEKGNISTDGIITVSNNGVEKVLSDVTLGIANKSIGAGKLTGGNAPAGAVATVGSNGVSVTYKPITAASISNKGTLTTDGIITVDNGVDKVLENFRLGINDKGITTAKLADGAVLNTQLGEKAVTANKISAEGITAASVLLSRGDGEVVWGELGDIVTDTAGNLATDGIIQMTNGTGENTLLKDVTLSIAPNSITKDKLSSANGATNMPLDYILVTNGQGGFDYVLKEAVQAGGVDLELGSALVFTEGTDGLNAVLAPTSIDVKVGGIGTTKLTDGAVTIAKISSSGADENTVLTADGLGNVTYKKINEAAFEGTEADLKSDGSLLIPIGNKAVLAETVIGIADAGVDTKHLKSNAVTNDKISSTVAGTAAANGTILTADGNGNTAFQSFETVAATQGKAVTSTDASLAVTANNKAALQDLNITVAQEGIKTTHLATRNVTADKIGSVDKESGLVLTTDGQGGAEFRSIGDALVGSGKALQGGTGITIGGTGAAQALLKDATVSISNGGVGETQLASNAVTAIKVATAAITEAKLASNAVTTAKIANTAVTADKLAVNAVVTTKINAEAVTDEKLATNAVTTVKIATNAVTEAKLATDAVTSAKIKDGAITNTKIANNAVGQNHIYVQNILEKHFGNSAVSERAIASNAVTTAKVADKAITKAKISAAGETVGHVLTVESNGNVAFKAPTGQSTTANLLGTSTIKVTGGTNAILSQATLEVNGNSIKTEHIVDRAITADELDNNAVETSKIANKAVTNEKLADDAVGTNQLQIESVWGNVIKEQGIESDRLSSVENSSNAPEGHVLTADGNGGVSFQPASGGSTSGGSGFFYAPSFTVEIVPGATASKNVYDIYKNQFNGAIKSRSSASIHTYEANQLDYFVVYYDEDVFEDIAISEQGILTYKTKRNIEITSKTYFNVVMQQKVD